CAQARRLREGRERARAVLARFTTRTREDSDLPALEIVTPNLMHAGHRDVKRAPDELQIPRRTERDVARRAGRDIERARLRTCARDCLDRARFQIDAPD